MDLNFAGKTVLVTGAGSGKFKNKFYKIAKF